MTPLTRHGLAVSPPPPSPPRHSGRMGARRAGPTGVVSDAPPEPEARGGAEGREEHRAP